MLRQSFALAVLCLLLGAALAAENWPEFRGPSGQGHFRAGSLPIEWGPGKNVVWKQSIPGLGWSSPVVSEGRVYLTTALPVEDSKDYSLRALCLDAASGKILWNNEVFHQDGKARRIQAKNSHASPTPLVYDGRLYVHFGHEGTACLDLNGKIVWMNTTLRYQPVHGNGGSPIVVDDKLIFSSDGSDQQFLVALDRSNGKVLWQTDRKAEAFKKFSFSTPLAITVKDKKQIISPFSNAVCGYDAQTGKEIWRVRYEGYSVVPRPVYGHGLVFICTGFDSPSLLAIHPDGEGDVTRTQVAWTTRKAVALTPSLLLVGDELYMISDGGVASCLDATTGQVHWQERLGGKYSASPLFADGKIYFQDEEGTAIIVKASKQYERVAKNQLGERTLASYAAVEGSLFLRTERQLYRIRAR